MEPSRKELGRIMAYKNPHAWAVPDSNEKEHRYFSLDSMLSKEGDTPLMRLLALHATPLTIKNFLFYSENCRRRDYQHGLSRQENVSNKPSTLEDGVLKSNHLGVSPLHVLLHRNSFYVGEIVRLLLSVDPTLVRRRMKITGSFPLHISMANSLTLEQEVLQDLLVVDPSVVYEEDVDGDNPVSLLYKNVLRFRWARNWVTRSMSPNAADLTSQSWMTVITPDQFLSFCTAMIIAAQGNGSIHGNITWHSICAFPRCPPLLIKILEQKMSTDSLLQQDEESCTPLHYAAKAAAMSQASIPQHILKESESTLELILSLAPQAALYKE
eukprot:scaffold12027_cov168-Amphora_coffeaeformis.AAC.2